MPAFNFEQMDDNPVFDVSASFDGGQVSNSRATLLQPNQLSELVNCDITISGQLETRRGTSVIGTNDIGTGTYIQGLYYFDSPSYQYPIAVNNRNLWALIGSTWTQLGVYTAVSSLVDVTMVQGVNNIYIIDGTTNIYSWDGVAYTNLGSASNAQPPAGVRAIAWHTSRLVAAGMLAEPDAIYFSGILAATVWDKTNWQVRVGGGEADLITGIVPWTNFNLLVLKKRSIWVVNCNPTLEPSDFSINPIHRAIGCLAPKTAVQVGSDIFFLSDSGVRSVQRTIASESQQQIGEALSYPIQDIIDRINPNAIATCAATYWNNRYILALPLDTATSPNTLVVFNNLTKSWSGTWPWVNATCFAVRGVPADLPRLSIGLNDGTVVDWLDYIKVGSETDTTFQDSGENIATSVLTRAFTFNEPACPKTGLNVELEFNRSDAVVTVEAVLDDGEPLSLQESPLMTGSGGLTLPLTLPFTFPPIGILRQACDLQYLSQFRELQLKLSASSGKLALRNMAASAFIDTLVLQKSTSSTNPRAI